MISHSNRRLPVVSIVITTKNEKKNIANCLQSVINQAYPRRKMQIIVVDNNSSDNTKAIAKRFTRNVYNCGPERSAQRNRGAKSASGKYYAYFDADMILSPNVIGECVEKLENNRSVCGLYIPEIIVGNDFWSTVRQFERSFYNATVIDCVRFIRLADFKIIDGFDTALVGSEDWDFDKKIRRIGDVDIISSPVYHNESGFNLKKYLDKKSYYMNTFYKYVKKWGKDDPDIRKQLGWSYRYFGVFTEKGKWVRLINHPILTVGMYFLRILVGIRFLLKKAV